MCSVLLYLGLLLYLESMKRRAGANRGKGGCCNRISLEKERYYERGERKGGAMRGTGTSTSQHSNNIHINLAQVVHTKF